MQEFLKDIKTAPLHGDSATDLSIILDTNILNYMLIPEARKQIDSFLENLVENGEIAHFKIHKSISIVSIYECLQGNNQQDYINLFKELKCYDVNIDVQYMAAQIKNFYRKEGAKKEDLPDLYISATAILTANGILTANESDYPTSIFKEDMTQHISWKTKEGRTKSIMLYLIRPIFSKTKEIFLKK